MRDELADYIGQLLGIERFRDYCPNGLQVEGRGEVKKIISGVSATLDLLQAAIAAQADAVLVHHGYFWKSEAPQIIGTKRRRLGLLLGHELNLFAYHLPLDAHSEFGNNVQLAKRLGIELQDWFGEQNIAAHGVLPQAMSLEQFSHRVDAALGRSPLVIGDPARTVRRIAWCSGGAQDYLGQAVALGVDAYLSGEISEHTVHLARESGVAFVAAGHHATERYGVQALGEHLAQRFGLEHRFIDLDNPV